MAKVDLLKMINERFTPEQQAAIHAKSAKMTEARSQARKQEDKMAKEGAEKLLRMAA